MWDEKNPVLFVSAEGRNGAAISQSRHAALFSPLVIFVLGVFTLKTVNRSCLKLRI